MPLTWLSNSCCFVPTFQNTIVLLHFVPPKTQNITDTGTRATGQRTPPRLSGAACRCDKRPTVLLSMSRWMTCELDPDDRPTDPGDRRGQGSRVVHGQGVCGSVQSRCAELTLLLDHVW